MLRFDMRTLLYVLEIEVGWKAQATYISAHPTGLGLGGDLELCPWRQ